jgi:hypothetical protein
MLRIIISFQIMDHRNFIREFLHYFSILLVNYGQRCSFHRKCKANLKCESHTFTISIRRSKSTAITCRVVCTELLVPCFNHFSWWNIVLFNIIKNSETFNCSWRRTFDASRSTLCFLLNRKHCILSKKRARKGVFFVQKHLTRHFVHKKRTVWRTLIFWNFSKLP